MPLIEVDMSVWNYGSWTNAESVTVKIHVFDSLTRFMNFTVESKGGLTQFLEKEPFICSHC